jgi:prevent-host-death family protein
MTKVGVAHLKAQLSRYLDAAKQGEAIVVTERGRPVAKIVPLRGADRADSRRERLSRAGLLLLGTGRLRPILRKPPKGPLVGTGVLRALLRERAEGR